MSGNKKSFAEVIESSLHQCTAQAWQWDTSAPFGSLVVIQDNAYPLIGIVHQIQMGSSDPGRIPFAYQKTQEELREQQPHIFNFFKTTLTILVIGYIENNSITYTTPPRPASLHAFVQLASSALLTEFFATVSYVHSLFGIHSSVVGMDELLCALVHHYTQYLNKKMIQTILHTYMLLIGGDYKRIRILARRITSLSIK